MMDFLRSGGVSNIVVILFGILGMVSAVLYARRPDPRRIEPLKALSWAIVFNAVLGWASCLAAVMYHVPNRPEWANSPHVAMIVMVGLGESLSPVILSFATLTVMWLLIAYGLRRAARMG